MLTSVMYRVTRRPNRLTSGPNGITAYTISAGTMEMMGAAVNTHLSARVGVMSSLIISFTASATGCRTPYGPTRIGPSRDCAHAITFRSRSTIEVTATRAAFKTITIFSSGMTRLSIISGPPSPIDLAQHDVE